VLLGENGAGKSTLMKVLAGINRPSRGKIFIKNEECFFHDIRDAEKKGISMIFQELNNAKNLTVAENIFLGKEPQKGIFIDRKKILQEAKIYLDHLGSGNIDVCEKVGHLTVAKQQMVEIAKALSNNSEIIIMDEPTSSFTDAEIRKLFETIAELKKKGVCIIYISHRMEEIFKIGDKITVLRDGKLISTMSIGETDINKLIQMMIGRSLNEHFPKIHVKLGDEVLRVNGITRDKKLKNISFYARKGEIVGIAGLVGAGRTELLRAVFGADPIEKGEIFVNGKAVKIKSPNDAIKHRIGFVTEDRKNQGLVLKLNVIHNITLANLKMLTNILFLNLRKETVLGQNQVEELAIKTPGLKQKVLFLSGGNQQKVVLAKWVITNSDILLIDEPTRGIDVGAKVEIYKLLGRLVSTGKTVVVVSSELPEILGISDRIYVMHEGEITGELNADEATQEKVLYHATGGK
jgi:ribose transport system ATP-binding protein